MKINGSPIQVGEFVAKSIEYDLKAHIEKQLSISARDIIKKVAAEIASQIMAVSEVDVDLNGAVSVNLFFNDKLDKQFIKQTSIVEKTGILNESK